jgi:hypothetical protein
MKVLSSVALTSNQKRVLAKIVASPTARVAGGEVSGDRNLAAARDELARLGAIEFVGNEASMTEKGEQLARDENLIDDAGQLTQDGQALAYTDPDGQEDKDVTKAPATTPPTGVPGGATPAPGAMPPPAATPPGGADLFASYKAPMSFKDYLKENGKGTGRYF